MRTLKFRIWDKVKKEFIPFAWVDIVEWQMQTCNPQSEYEFQQFTGLLDLEGKEIYEGDILRISNGERLVADLIDFALVPEESRIVWLERSRIGEYYGSNSETSWYSLLDYDVWEVIGNIMQNPELLKP